MPSSSVVDEQVDPWPGDHQGVTDALPPLQRELGGGDDAMVDPVDVVAHRRLSVEPGAHIRVLVLRDPLVHQDHSHRVDVSGAFTLDALADRVDHHGLPHTDQVGGEAGANLFRCHARVLEQERVAVEVIDVDDAALPRFEVVSSAQALHAVPRLNRVRERRLTVVQARDLHVRVARDATIREHGLAHIALQRPHHPPELAREMFRSDASDGVHVATGRDSDQAQVARRHVLHKKLSSHVSSSSSP